MNNIRSAYEWWQSFGPVGLAAEFLAVVSVVSIVLWRTCQTRSPVFWRRTDYAYFLFAIVGGAAGAADLAVNNWTKQLDQIQVNTLANQVLLRGYVSSALAICERQKAQERESVAEREKQRRLFGHDVINPQPLPPRPPKETFDDLPEEWLSKRECEAANRVWSDIETNSLKTATEYDFETNRRPPAAIYREPIVMGKVFNGIFNSELTPKIAASVLQLADARAREHAIKEQLSSLSYFSILKSLSPILLGLGIGIRLSRTHYDVRTEERKAKAQQRA